MNITITKNATFNSYEIHFDGKPAESVRNLLKTNGYRWHGKRGIWYGYKDIDDILNGATVEQSTNAETPKKITAKESRLTYTAHGIKGKNGEKIGGCGDMVDYLPAYYDFDAVRLEIRLTIKDYKTLRIIPNGCNCVDNSDYMTDYYENEHLTIPATAGAEFLAAAVGYKKHLEVLRKKGEKMDYYRREYEAEQRKADALELAEQIASGTVENGVEIIAERIQAEQNRQEQLRLSENKAFAAELLKEGNRDGQTVEQHGDKVIYRKATRMQIFDGSPLGFGRVETLETVICINIRTGEREQIQHAPLAEAYEFYKRVAA